MNILLKTTVVLAVGLLAETASAAVLPLKIGWSELRSEQGAAGDATGKPDETLSSGLEGQVVELKGYLLPVDREGYLVYEFLLVPWAGACSHMAQPPPNQVVHVFPEKPYRASASYEPVEISGTMRLGLETTQLFIMDGVVVVESGYRVGLAKVEKTDDTGLPPVRKSNPWSFITK